MQLIVNADDLGISPEVNEAIFDLMAQGLVTSATLLANAPFVTEAAGSSKHFPSCSFGVHLNLTQFRPMTSDSSSLDGLLSRTGEFNGWLDTDPDRVKKTPSLITAVANEWSCQIESVLKQGVKISHLDSHQHVHTIPFLFPALKIVQARFGIRKVRLTRNVFQRSVHVTPAKRAVKALFNFCLRHVYKTTTTTMFLDFSTFHECLRRGEAHWPSVEVMVHPGSEAAYEENKLFVSTWKEAFCGTIRLISYNQL